MPRFNRFSVLCSLFAVSVSNAAVGPQALELSNMGELLPSVNAFDLDPAKPVPKKGGLLELKWLELRKQYPACRNLAAKLQPAHKDVEGWIARTRLECALKASAEGKDVAALGASFDAVKSSLLLEGTWKDSLRDVWVRAGMTLADAAAKTKPAESQRRLEALLDRSDVLTKDQRFSAYVLLGNIAAQKKDLEQALFFLRQAEELAATSAVQNLIAQIEARKSPKKEPVVAPETPASPTGAEAEADVEIQKFLADRNHEEAIKRMVEILNRFPNGRFSKRYRERILELFANVADKDENDGARLRAAARDADASRLAEWAGQLHRRGDDLGSLDMAERALEKNNESPQASWLAWIAGRGAAFTGQNDKAVRYFDRVVQFHSASEEAPESLFRLALLQVRLGNYTTAAHLFDKLIAQNRPKWELNARYWRVRCLEKIDKEKFVAERDELVLKFPFTYYGLKLKAENEGGVLEFPKNDRSPLEATTGRLWLVGAQKRAWERFRKLSSEGWLLEAQAELASLPAPQAPWAMIQWARGLSKAGQYPAAIILISRAIDKDETLRHPRYLDGVFPKAYGRWIEAGAKDKSLDPVLVRSLIRQESAYGLRAVSTSSAMGLMQMIPPTAREIAEEMRIDVAIPEDMYRPEVNVPMGTHYLAKMLREFEGTVPLALAAYNAGPHKVKRWMKGREVVAALKGRDFASWEDEIWYDELPWQETSFYVKAILRNVLLDRLIDQGRVTVAPSFWSDLRKVAGPVKTEEDVKRR